MAEPWVWGALAAAAFQTVRFMLHKRLAEGVLTATGSTFARFAYAAPAAALALALYLAATGLPLPAVMPGFWGWAVLGGAGQILATVLVVLLFRRRNFASGIALKKTEVLQTAILGIAVLGEGLPPLGWAAIGLGLAGVLLLSKGAAPGAVAGAALRDPAALALGLGSGLFFAVAGVGYRAATLAVDSPDALSRAGVALVVVTLLQGVAMAAWLRMRQPGELTRAWAARRRAAWLGLTSMAGSWCWFTAFTLQNAALVYAVGQVELILSLAASVLWFRERVSARELAGIAVLGISILLVVAAG